MVVAKVREWLTIRKHAAQKFDRERFNLWKLGELQVREEYQIKISNRYAALKNLHDSEDMHTVWENIKENIKTLAQESRSVWIEAA